MSMSHHPGLRDTQDSETDELALQEVEMQSTLDTDKQAELDGHSQHLVRSEEEEAPSPFAEHRQAHKGFYSAMAENSRFNASVNPVSRFALAKSQKSMFAVCLVLTVAIGLVLICVAVFSPGPSLPTLEPRDAKSGWVYVLRDPETNVRLVHYEHAGPGSADKIETTVIEGWSDDSHSFTLWVNRQDRTATLLETATGNCHYRAPLYERVPVDLQRAIEPLPRGALPSATGALHVSESAFTVDVLPQRWALSAFQNPEPTEAECTFKQYPVRDFATSAPEPWTGASFPDAALSPVEVLAQQQDLDTGVDSPYEFDSEAYTGFLSRMRFNVTDNTLVNYSAGLDGWPFVGENPTGELLDTCAGVRESVPEFPGLFEACASMLMCVERTSRTPPQGYPDYSQQCVHAQTRRPCECLSLVAGSLYLPRVNGCGVCTLDNPEGCRCLAYASVLTIAMQQTPCVSVETLPHSLAHRATTICGTYEVCSRHISRHCKSAALPCEVLPEGPVLSCYSSLAQQQQQKK